VRFRRNSKGYVALLFAERKAAALTQTMVAERLGKPPSYVAKYEGGADALMSSYS